MRLRTISIFIFVFATVFAVSGGAVEPITGAAFDSLIAAQDTLLQRELDSLLQYGFDCQVYGPIDPLLCEDTGFFTSFHTIRIISSEIWRLGLADASLKRHAYQSELPGMIIYSSDRLECYVPIQSQSPGRDSLDNGLVQLLTVQQNRYLLWLRTAVGKGWLSLDEEDRLHYKNAVYRHLMTLASQDALAPPVATDFDLPERFDFYAEPPDYVIQGYQNYKDYLHAHAELTTEFASGITAFVPTTATLDWMKENAPREAHPNKEAAALQQEYRKFFERGGDTRMMQTLTRAGFDTLASGEYFFAVGLNGTIRFGRELLREEVVRIEKETGRKVPRANHAFLFPGEPVLTAGAFFIDERADIKLVKVNAQSGHFFYSNISETIRDDIAIRSDHYLLTLGHFFIALDRLSIEYEGILISKL